MSSTEKAANAGEKRITKRDLVMSWLIWTFFSHSNYNYERLQASAFAHAMVPIIKRLYGGDKEQTREALQRHLVFFNTAPDIGGVIHGITIAMEEQKANGEDVTDNAITSTKTGLMGPMAGIGDTISQGIVTPLLIALGISVTGLGAEAQKSGDLSGITGNPLGPILYFVLISAFTLLIGYFFYTQGFKQGRSFVTSVLKSGLMDKVIMGASVLGNIVLGALTAQFVKVYVGWTVHAGDNTTVYIQQDVLDKILPGLLPLGLVVLTWWLLMRGWHPIKLLVIYVIICIVGAIPFMGPQPKYITDACGSSILQPYGPCQPPAPPTDESK
ncbi:MAG: PTS system mannose/fructose/sorbose family transporter subunit IID [Microbacteriaceae bacterium]|nr:PTS system mannose/fructose/sorbose family transporter subunit IID [Cryobacterium sp.]MBX3104687.1 PTS system mannose/fructose/sorbose family transporter subunit IID [Cryobacterium sp.]MCC6376597.1 PTS system mannose/fructose/sorbose family transporter subunit IID [Microbacteriaceae bacterium]